MTALVRHTDQVVHLDDHELAVLRSDSYRTFTLDARPTDKRPATTEVVATAFDRAGHEHFLHKEIHEQPASVAQTLSGRLEQRFATAHLGGLDNRPATCWASGGSRSWAAGRRTTRRWPGRC